jgi:hypothetical protein
MAQSGRIKAWAEAGFCERVVLPNKRAQCTQSCVGPRGSYVAYATRNADRNSIDPFINPRRNIGGQRQSEPGECRAINTECELRWTCNRQVSWIGATEYLVHVLSGIVVTFVVTWTKRHKPARNHVFDVAVNERQLVFGRAGCKRKASGIDEGVNSVHECLRAKCESLTECWIDILRRANVQRLNFDAKFSSF